MPLISCPDCNKDVSDRAQACPNCGAPIAPEFYNSGAGLITIQATKKGLKLHSLGASALIILSLIVVAVIGEKPSVLHFIPALLFVGGLGWFIVTQVRIWWHHS